MLVSMTKIIKDLGKTATGLMPNTNTTEGLIKLGFITAGLYTGNIECLYALVNYTLLDQWFGPRARKARRLETLEAANGTDTKSAKDENHSPSETELSTITAPTVEKENAEPTVGPKAIAASEKKNSTIKTEAQAGYNHTLPETGESKNPTQAVKAETTAAQSAHVPYSEGVAMFKAAKYDMAITRLEYAIALYQKASPISKQVATCFSTLSSCYRELAKTNSEEKLRHKAIQFLDQAIAIGFLLIDTMTENEKTKLLKKKETLFDDVENSDKALSIYASAMRALTENEFQQPSMAEYKAALAIAAEKMSLSINYGSLTEEKIRELQLPDPAINALLLSKTRPEVRKQKEALLSTLNAAGFAQLQQFFADPEHAQKAVELQRQLLINKA